MINEFAAFKIYENLPARKNARYQKWKPITRYELLKMFAVIIAMGIDKRPKLSDYWAMDPINYTPWYHQMFSRNRFELLHSSMLHVGSVGDEKATKDKIEPFLNSLLKKFQDAFYPGKNLSIDEMVVKWKGRSKYKMYNPNKPEKYHIKTFGVCDSVTGYAVNLLIYFGKDTSFQEGLEGGQSEKVFEYLLRPLGSGHHVFADRYYTTYNLITYLSSKNTYYTGTLQLNRKNFPEELKTSKLAHLDSKFYRSEKNKAPLVCQWKDKKAKKPVTIVSTHEIKGETEVRNKRDIATIKPIMVNEYNNAMNGCDRMDQMLLYYNVFNRKTVKWWKRLFMWCLEVSQANAFILFCLTRYADDKKNLSLLKFKKMLITELLVIADEVKPVDYEPHRIIRPNRLVNTPSQHCVVWTDSARICVVCSKPPDRKRTHFKCSTCDIYIHPKSCFEQFHSK